MATAIMQVILVPKTAFVPYYVRGNHREHVYLDLNPNKVFDRQIVIAPHHDEAWLDIHLFKLALYCRGNNIRLVSIGTENQLPFFSMFSDAVILQRGVNMHGLVEWLTGFDADTAGFESLDGWNDVYDFDALEPVYSPIMLSHIVAAFSSFDVLIREESYVAFLQADLPQNFVWCEVKQVFLEYLISEASKIRSILPLVGLDKEFQKNLIRLFGSHFMAIQILASLLKGARFFCGAGSAHVFTIAPVNIAICVGIDPCFDNETAEVLRRFTINRFGIMPLVYAGQEFDLQDRESKCWDFDYFLTHEFMERFLNGIGTVKTTEKVVVKAWDTYLSERGATNELHEQTFRMQRCGKYVKEVLLCRDGTIIPGDRNESYWSVIGGALVFYGESGQPSTIFTQAGDLWSGTFLFNGAVTHVLRKSMRAGAVGVSIATGQ